MIELSVSDQDGPGNNNGIVEFQIQSGANDDFVIQRDTGKILVASNPQLDVDSQRTYTIIVSYKLPCIVSSSLVVAGFEMRSRCTIQPLNIH